jgi:hypothetical protein
VFFYVRPQLESCVGINRSSAAVTNTVKHFHFLPKGKRLFALHNEQCVHNEVSNWPIILV